MVVEVSLELVLTCIMVAEHEQDAKLKHSAKPETEMIAQ